MAIEPGIVSITFRQHAIDEIIDLAKQNGLKGIEWGGDVHVPHGDLEQARKVGNATRQQGLEVAAYGSYYRLGESQADLPFETVLETAEELGADVIRVWAGRKGSDEADEAYWAAVTEDALQVADKAASKGISIAYEYHDKTLTDGDAAARRLLQATQHRAVQTLWQPLNHLDREACWESLDTVLPRLANLHVFYWGPGGFKDRHPLQEGEALWKPVLEKVVQNPARRFALLEFVKGDDPDQFKKDAATLVNWLAEVSGAT